MSEANTLLDKSGDASERRKFAAFVTEHFDAAYYLDSNRDVAQAGLVPLQHWLTYGFREGRQISKSVIIRCGEVARRSTDRVWTHYRWQGEDIAVQWIRPLPGEIISQVVNQARHDAAVLALGQHCLTELTPAHRENVHFDVVGLQRAIRHSAEFLLIVPNLSVNRIMVDLVAALSQQGIRSVLTIVADHGASNKDGTSPIPEPFGVTDVLFWRDLWIEGAEAVKLGQLAQLIRALRPRVTIVADSRHGYEIIARFGRALSECTKMFCVYSSGPQSREYAARFPRRTLPFATALTDDATLAAKLDAQYGDLLGHGVKVLPQDCSSGFAEAIAKLFSEA